MKKKICVITSSRADYGLLKPLLKEIKLDKSLTLQLIVRGMHLSAAFGLTFRDIKKDGFKIDRKVNIGLRSDTPVGISASMALAVKGFAEALLALKPDIVVVLGDRFEIFAAVSAATVSLIPVAHISGGEITEGVFDDAFRNSITKMSHLHFASTASHRKRVVQLGESPDRVFNVGALGLDAGGRSLLTKGQLEKYLGVKFNKKNLLVTFHPVTLEANTAKGQDKNLLGVLKGQRETTIIFTKANADTGGSIINKMIDAYVSEDPENAKVFASLGHLNCLSVMKCVDAVVGNSSSGIVEAPSLKVGTINIGDRQRGRIKAKSVIDCPPTIKGIRSAFRKLYSKGFQKGLEKTVNPYSGKKTAGKIKDILKKFDTHNILKKSFYDINFSKR